MNEGALAGVLTAIITILGGVILWQQNRVTAKDAQLAKSDEERRAELRADFAEQVRQIRADYDARLVEKDALIARLWRVAEGSTEGLEDSALVAEAALVEAKRRGSRERG